jgi:hypothetical protein
MIMGQAATTVEVASASKYVSFGVRYSRGDENGVCCKC